MPLSEKIQQINREISATVERAISDLRQEVSQRLRAGHDEILRRLDEITPELPSAFIPEELGAEAEELAHETARQVAEKAEEAAAQRASGARGEAFTAIRDALAGIDRARSQAEILAALLRESGRFASRAAVLLWRGTELRGWGGQGFGDAEPAIRDLAFAAAPGSGWARLGDGQAAVRLSAQAMTVALCLASLPPDARLLQMLPPILERLLLGLAWLWFINLFNFMDGIDGLAGSETIAVALGYLAFLSYAGLEDPFWRVRNAAVRALLAIGASIDEIDPATSPRSEGALSYIARRLGAKAPEPREIECPVPEGHPPPPARRLLQFPLLGRGQDHLREVGQGRPPDGHRWQ